MLSTSQLGADLDLDPCSIPPSIAHQPHNTSPLGLHHPAPNLALTPASSAPSNPPKKRDQVSTGSPPYPCTFCTLCRTAKPRTAGPQQRDNASAALQGSQVHCRTTPLCIQQQPFNLVTPHPDEIIQPEQRCSACSTNLCTPPHQTQNQPDKDGRKSQNSKSAAPAE